MQTETESEAVKLVGADELAKILSVSVRHIWRQRAAGKLPRPVTIGQCVRWLLSDIDTWLDRGCPSQQQFETRKAAQNKQNGVV